MKSFHESVVGMCLELGHRITVLSFLLAFLAGTSGAFMVGTLIVEHDMKARIKALEDQHEKECGCK